MLLTLTLTLAGQPRDLGFEASQRVALVVGNGAYARSPLRNPGNDARAVAESLAGLGFRTETAIDLTLPQLDRAISRFVGQVKAGDTALFYYAGHGLQIEGENYLVPVDFDAKDEADAKYAAYSASRVQERIEKAGARVILVVLDACRNNPFAATRSAGSGLAAMGSGKGTLIAFATAPGKTADDNPRGANGLFTTHLIEALREPGLSVDQVFNRVRERVYTESKGRQVPWTVSSVIGDVYLRGGRAAAPVEAVAAVNPLTRIAREAAAAPAVNAAETLASGTAALERGDFEQAIQQAQEVLRTEAANKEALHLLTFGYYKTERWDLFVSTARQAIRAGDTLQFLFGHHHTLAGIHAAMVTLTRERIQYKPLQGNCNQAAMDVPRANLQSAQGVRSAQGELFLNLKILDEKNKARNFNFADADSTVTQNASGLPQVVSPPKAAAMLQAVASVLQLD
jgi:uncharacterized caspase-like protein